MNYKSVLEKAKKIKNRKHETYEIEILLAELYFELLEIPRWKFWKWIPLMNVIAEIEFLHKDCCNL